jgi:branched-chain amino acid transport system ATP-binding protein
MLFSPGGLSRVAASRRMRPEPDSPIPDPGRPVSAPGALEPDTLPPASVAAGPEEVALPVTHLLRADDLAVRFGGVRAVDGLNLAVRRGELIGLIGPNGAGKTTALRLLTGLLKPDSGRIVLEGVDVTALPVHRRARLGLSSTHQIVRPFRGVTALHNVLVAAGHQRTRSVFTAFASVSRRAERRRALELLRLVGLAPVAGLPTDALPLGQLKRLEVARALALEPRLVVLDEPLAGLNSGEAEALAETILTLHRGGLTVVLIEHNLGEVLRISQRLVVLVGGRVVADGEPAATVREAVVQDAYVGTAGDHAAA